MDYLIKTHALLKSLDNLIVGHPEITIIAGPLLSFRFRWVYRGEVLTTNIMYSLGRIAEMDEDYFLRIVAKRVNDHYVYQVSMIDKEAKK